MTTPAAVPSDGSSDKGLVERLLSPIADVRRGEALSALLMALTMFMILAGYYLLKTAREVFILNEGGAAVKSYSSAGQALLLLVLVPAYGAFASRVNRIQLVQWVTLFFAANLGLFLLARAEHLRIGIIFFLWIGIFNVMVIAQYWAFANDLFTPEQGKRLFPLIGVGSSLGAWIGAERAGQVVAAVGPDRLLAGGAVILVICTVLVRIVDGATRRGGGRAAKTADEKIEGGANGFSLLLQNRYLLLIGAMIVLLNLVNSTGEFMFGRYVVASAEAAYGTAAATADARGRFIGEAYSSYFANINLIGFLLQLFVVSRLLKLLGVGRTIFLNPLFDLVGYAFVAIAPTFQAMRWLKIGDNSLAYSVGNTSNQALWLPTSREAKYKAKQAVDSFCVRAGDVVSAGVVYAGTTAGLGMQGFAVMNLVLIGGWLGSSFGLKRELAVNAATSGGREL